MAFSISIAITQNSQSVTNNSSNVTVKVNASWTGGTWSCENLSKWVKIDGTTYYFSDTDLNAGQSTSGSATLYTKTLNIPHNSDGTKTLSVSASVATTTSSGTQTASTSKALTTIPRKSSISAVAASALGSASTITVTRQSTSFTHTITYKCGTATGTICTKSSSTSVSWTPPTSLASQNTTGNSLTVTFTIETFNGTTSLGTNTWVSYAYTIPDNSTFKPTVSLAVEDAYSYRGTYGAYVQGKSKLKITVTAAGKNSATIKSYSTTIDGKTYTTKSITTPVISGTGTLTITTTVTDSRGFKNSTTWDVDVLAYSAPKITTSNVYRTDSSGNKLSSGGYLTVTFTGEIASLNNQNAVTYAVKYKKVSETSYSTPATATNGSYTFAADTGSSYDIILTATDALVSVDKTLAGPSISKLLSMLDNRGLAIGKVAELLDRFDVNFISIFRKGVEFLQTITIANNAGFYARDSNGTERHILTLNGSNNLLIGWDLYENNLGNNVLYGKEIMLLPGSSGLTTAYRPYYRAGDTITIATHITGLISSDKKNLYFTIPLSKPILGTPTISVTSIGGVIVRQTAKYCYGSAASTYVKPSSYTCDLDPAGIGVIAVMANTTNVVNNNETCDIELNIRITLS